ncbi:MAG: protein phosphatase 2C domain-containing protein [Desulfobulbaceae bacterium]|nr:protein phosphatase 2C domain-containing protein [Desulfobulbaceae bacterium]
MIWNFLKNLFQSPQQPLSLFGRTDTGRTRPNNEDSFVILPQSRIMMVADGMGGHNAGEVASRAAIESMVHLLDTTNSLQKAGSNQEAIRHILIHTLRQTNDQIMLMACENSSYSGMGSTFIIAFVNRGSLFTCHVGDVRAYLLTAHGLRQLTTDHTYLAEFTRKSETKQNTSSPRVKMTRHVVSRAIGFPFPEDPECTTNPITAGDRILLCSDGLWSMLPDRELASILREASTPEDACDRLIAEANQAGGKDNITAVVSFI